MDIKLNNLMAVHLLWLVPILIGLFAYGFRRRAIALHAFVNVGLVGKLVPDLSIARRRIKAVLFIGSIAAVIVALVDPRWNVHFEEVQRRGIDVIFCLDVSRSMLAEDVTPNRLDRAKQYIQQVVDNLSGDRVGLVTFAGSAIANCPLTIDYGAFRMVLDDVDIRSTARGGTLIGDAVRVATDSFADEIKKYKAVIVITDGDDQESYPTEAASKAFAEHGIRVYTVGIGDLSEGSRIPIVKDGRRSYVTYEGQEIWSKLNEQTLQAMATSGGGRYIPIGTQQTDMGEVFSNAFAKDDLREFASSRIERYDVQFQWFAAFALLLLIIESVLPERQAVSRIGT